MSRRTLYPDIEPYDSGPLAVSDGHTLYYEQAGNPEGQPALFVHRALSLATVWTKAGLRIVPDAGHHASEPGTVDVLIHATDALRR